MLRKRLYWAWPFVGTGFACCGRPWGLDRWLRLLASHGRVSRIALWVKGTVGLMQNASSLAAQLLNLALPVAPGLSKAVDDPLIVDLRQAGLSSIAATRMMLEIEAFFNISIPDSDLTPENFATIRTIERLIERLSA